MAPRRPTRSPAAPMRRSSRSTPATGALAFVGAPDFEAPTDAGGDNVYDVIVRASDGTPHRHPGDRGHRRQRQRQRARHHLERRRRDRGGLGGRERDGRDHRRRDRRRRRRRRPIRSAGGADAAKFTIDAATGALIFVAAPDFEAPTDAGGDNVYDVVVSATDGTPPTARRSPSPSPTSTTTRRSSRSNGGGATASISVAENATAVTTVDGDGRGSAPRRPTRSPAAPTRRCFRSTPPPATSPSLSPPDSEAPGDDDTNNVYEVTVTASDGDALRQSGHFRHRHQCQRQCAGHHARTAAAPPLRVGGGERRLRSPPCCDRRRWNQSRPTRSAAAPTRRSSPSTPRPARSPSATAPDSETPADADADNVYEVTVVASDGTNTDTQAISVTVTNVNDSAR